MPIYEYKCQKCGEEFEVFQGIADPTVKSCKFCKGSVQKLMSLSTFHLKGNGWYATDYGGKKAPAAEKTATDKKEAKTSETEKSQPPSKTTSEE
ncbi:MAG: zinc ribbon domain-containing protein [Proteobacteria bacterium]|nr:zinc ribbon domain-containing protein [Pseudomonadota bacterium]MBU1966235.1 zinc ribbon domain-containing protein [Pseudomonadota bacterium]MBU4581575.1 zinc ribbon domain-containing protein [Pseudomonadota bacterium]